MHRKTTKNRHTFISDEFYSDISTGDMLYAVLVRSPFPYGTLTDVSFDKEAKIPDGYHFFSAKDISGKKYIRTLGQKTAVFCNGKIGYKGECIGILVGPDKKVLHELKKKVMFSLDSTEIIRQEREFSKSYDSLAVVPKNGKPHKAVLFDEQETQSEIIAERIITAGTPDQILKKRTEDSVVIEGNWKDMRQYHPNKETAGVFCQMKGGNIHIYAPVLWISHLRTSVAEVTGIPEEKIIITRTKNAGENLNLLWQISLLAARTCIATCRTGKPVLLQLSRREQEQIIERPPEIAIRHRTAVHKTGKIMAMDVLIEFNAGFGNPFAMDIVNRLAVASCGIYSPEHVRIRARATQTHNPPPYIHSIDSQVFYAVENQIQKIAEMTGLSPIELRRINKCRLPTTKTAFPFFFDIGKAEDAVSAVAKKSDFTRKYAVYRLAEKGRYEYNSNAPFSPPLRGIALACGFEGSGYLGTESAKMSPSLQITLPEENKIVIHSVPPSQSILEIWAKMITDELSIEKKNISFDFEPETELAKKAQGKDAAQEFYSDDISIKTILLKKCLATVKRKKEKAFPMTVRKNIPPSKKSQWNHELFRGTPFLNTSFGACTVELELDACTYREKLLGICIVIDAGKILSIKPAENTVKLAVEQCLSTVVDEEIVRCASVSVQFMQSEKEPKQIGHIVYSILPAAFSSALSQALATTVSKLPIQTDTLYELSEGGLHHENPRHS